MHEMGLKGRFAEISERRRLKPSLLLPFSESESEGVSQGAVLQTRTIRVKGTVLLTYLDSLSPKLRQGERMPCYCYS